MSVIGLQKLQEELNLAGLANFEKGAVDSINPELPIGEQADLLPYDRTWEFPRERLFLGKKAANEDYTYQF
jgi:FMS-like tyrosine kinase 1